MLVVTRLLPVLVLLLPPNHRRPPITMTFVASLRSSERLCRKKEESTVLLRFTTKDILIDWTTAACMCGWVWVCKAVTSRSITLLIYDSLTRWWKICRDRFDSNVSLSITNQDNTIIYANVEWMCCARQDRPRRLGYQNHSYVMKCRGESCVKTKRTKALFLFCRFFSLFTFVMFWFVLFFKLISEKIQKLTSLIQTT
jgi:hypothetical protein